MPVGLPTTVAESHDHGVETYMEQRCRIHLGADVRLTPKADACLRERLQFAVEDLLWKTALRDVAAQRPAKSFLDCRRW